MVRFMHLQQEQKQFSKEIKFTHISIHTVDGRNPAPVDIWFIPLLLGFQPSKVVQDFFHPQYHISG